MDLKLIIRLSNSCKPWPDTINCMTERNVRNTEVIYTITWEYLQNLSCLINRFSVISGKLYIIPIERGFR